MLLWQYQVLCLYVDALVKGAFVVTPSFKSKDAYSNGIFFFPNCSNFSEGFLSNLCNVFIKWHLFYNNSFLPMLQREKSARQMEEKTTKREIKACEQYVEAREKAMKARDSERLCKLALVVSWGFFVFVMLVFCFALRQQNRI